MATQVQNRRGSTAEHSTFTGAVGEVTVDTDKEVVVVHDGTTAGGYPQMRENGSNSALALGSAATPSLKFTGDTNTGIYSPGADQVAISTAGSGRLFVAAGGNVGIGTASPGVNLDVSSASNTTIRAITTDATGASIAGIQLDQSGSGASTLIMRAGNNLTTLSATTNTPLIFGTNNTERARIDSSGRLLVGTSSSIGGALLQVADAAGNCGRFYGSSTATAGTYLVLGRSNGTLASPTVSANNDVLGAVYFDGYNGSSFIGAASIRAEVDGVVSGGGANDMPGRLVFSTTADGAASPTERLRITSAGVLQVADAGNIAVGTTTGTKIGTATTQKLGFFNKTPVVQPAAVADATDAASVITQLNALLARMRDLGLIAT